MYMYIYFGIYMETLNSVALSDFVAILPQPLSAYVCTHLYLIPYSSPLCQFITLIKVFILLLLLVVMFGGGVVLVIECYFDRFSYTILYSLPTCTLMPLSLFFCAERIRTKCPWHAMCSRANLRNYFHMDLKNPLNRRLLQCPLCPQKRRKVSQ